MKRRRRDPDEDERLRDFAAAAVEAARAVPMSSPYRFGRHKVFLAALDPSSTTKRLLVEAHRKGYLRLARADLTNAMDRRIVRESEVRGGPDNAFEWHLIQV